MTFDSRGLLSWLFDFANAVLQQVSDCGTLYRMPLIAVSDTITPREVFKAARISGHFRGREFITQTQADLRTSSDRGKDQG